MENILEWAEKIGKSTQNKSTKSNKLNKKLQEELFQRIDIALKEKSSTMDECVSAFCKFDPRVIDPFYNSYYKDFSYETRLLWDAAMLRWACINTGKNIIRSVIRIASVIFTKLPVIQSVNEIIPELKWLSLAIDERSISRIEYHRDQSEVNDLKKLLDLDMTAWTAGKEPMLKLYNILFSECLDTETQKKYQEFVLRHTDKKEVSETITEDKKSLSEDEKNTLTSEQTKGKKLPSENESNSQPRKADTVENQKQLASQEKKKCVSENDKEDKKSFVDGIVLAEELVRWAKEQKTKMSEQVMKNAQSSAEIQKQKTKISDLNCELNQVKTDIAALRKKKEALENEVSETKSIIENLLNQKTEAENTIKKLQQMAANSIRQELDGFKAKLAKELANDVKDFREDYSEEEKTEVYSAFLEDMIDILKRNGIPLEEK